MVGKYETVCRLKVKASKGGEMWRNVHNTTKRVVE
jgi:hypothetical protein